MRKLYAPARAKSWCFATIAPVAAILAVIVTGPGGTSRTAARPSPSVVHFASAENVVVVM